MKKNIIFLCLCLGTIIGCQNLKKESKLKKIIEVSFDSSDNITSAEVRITADTNGEFSEEVQMFEGTYEEVMEKVQLITKKTEGVIISEIKTIKKIRFSLILKVRATLTGQYFLLRKMAK